MSIIDAFKEFLTRPITVRAPMPEAPAPARRSEAEATAEAALRVTKAERRSRGHELYAGYLSSGNPATQLVRVTPQQSTSVANNIYARRDAWLYDLFDEMITKDATIFSVRNVFASAVLAYQRYLMPPDDATPAEMEAYDYVQNMILGCDSDFDFDALVRELALYPLDHGFSVHEIIWAAKDGYYAPTHFIHRHPAQFAFDDWGNLYVDSQFADGADYQPSVSAGGYSAMDPRHFIVRRTRSKYGNPYGESILYFLWAVYWFKKTGLRAWINDAENFGTPLAIATIETTAEGTPDSRRALQTQAMTILNRLAESIGVFLPPEIALDFKDRGGRSTSPHPDLIAYMDQAIRTVYLGATLQVAEAEHGTRAQAEVHAKTSKGLVIAEAVDVAKAIQRRLINPAVLLNFGEGVRPPRFVIDTDDGESIDEKIKAYDNAAARGVKFSEKAYREDLAIAQPGDDADALAGLMTKNEARAWLGFPPTPDGERPVTQDELAVMVGMKTGAPAPPAQFSEADGGPDPSKKKALTPEPFVSFAEANPSSRAGALEFLRRVEKIAAELYGENKAEQSRALQKALDEIERAAALTGINIEAPALIGSLSEATLGVRALSLLNAYRTAKKHLPAEVIEAAQAATVETMDPLYKQAFDWMNDRGVATRAEVEKMAEAVTALGGESAENIVRREVLALAKSPSLGMTELIKGEIADAIKAGETPASFTARMTAYVEKGELPPNQDAYLRLVVNQETANAYKEQRQAAFDAPEIRDFVWGRRFHSANLPTSRPGHKGMDGVLIKKGSEADREVGAPPWAFNCHCVESQIMHEDGGAAPYEETPDALERVRKIERFTD